jgi:hypothetical protein
MRHNNARRGRTQQRRAEGGGEGERGVKQTNDKSWYEEKSKGVRPAGKKKG